MIRSFRDAARETSSMVRTRRLRAAPARRSCGPSPGASSTSWTQLCRANRCGCRPGTDGRSSRIPRAGTRSGSTASTGSATSGTADGPTRVEITDYHW